MGFSLDDKLVVAISSRALFDLDAEHQVFTEHGLEAYRSFQVSHEDEPLEPGTGFPLVQALLSINARGKGSLVEVVLVSRNDADTGLRVMNSMEHYGLPIQRAGFTGGRAPYTYLQPFQCDLFLSANEEDVHRALSAGFAAGLVYRPPTPMEPGDGEVRIAFDGDAVLFDPEAENVYRQQGLAEFHRREKESSDVPLAAGPFKGFLTALHLIQTQFGDKECPIRTALVTARSAPAHKRAVKTLRAWNVQLNEVFFLGGVSKAGVLKEFKPHIFFDDQSHYCEPASVQTPTARVLSAEANPLDAPKPSGSADAIPREPAPANGRPDA